MIPSREDLKKLARNVSFKEACTLSCKECDWRHDKTDCRILAKNKLADESYIDNTQNQ